MAGKTTKAAGRPKAKQEAKNEGTTAPMAKAILPTASEVAQVFTVNDSTSPEDVLRYAGLPGTELAFDVVHFPEYDESFVAMLPASAQKAYWTTKAEWDRRDSLAKRAVFETTSVDPMTKLLDGPHGMSNPLVRDQEYVQKLMPGFYITWRIEGGQGDIDNALRAGFRVMRRPKDDTEAKTKSPQDWSGERWKVRDGTSDPTSGEEISNVMVYISEQAWKDNIAAMSMVSHNAYAANKKKFVEGVDNLSRDMLSSKERIQVADLDEVHVEEHVLTQDGKRVRMSPES